MHVCARVLLTPSSLSLSRARGAIAAPPANHLVPSLQKSCFIGRIRQDFPAREVCDWSFLTKLSPRMGFPPPNIVTLGQKYNIGEKPIVILDTNINHDVGTPKQTQTRYTVFLNQEFRTAVK